MGGLCAPTVKSILVTRILVVKGAIPHRDRAAPGRARGRSAEPTRISRERQHPPPCASGCARSRWLSRERCGFCGCGVLRYGSPLVRRTQRPCSAAPLPSRGPPAGARRVGDQIRRFPDGYCALSDLPPTIAWAMRPRRAARDSHIFTRSRDPMLLDIGPTRSRRHGSSSVKRARVTKRQRELRPGLRDDRWLQ